MNIVVEKKIYLKVDQKFFDEKFKDLEKIFKIDEIDSRVKKIYAECPYVGESLSMKNFFLN